MSRPSLIITNAVATISIAPVTPSNKTVRLALPNEIVGIVEGSSDVSIKGFEVSK